MTIDAGRPSPLHRTRQELTRRPAIPPLRGVVARIVTGPHDSCNNAWIGDTMGEPTLAVKKGDRATDVSAGASHRRSCSFTF